MPQWAELGGGEDRTYISVRLAHRVHSRLTTIMGAIETGKKELAVEEVHRLARLIAAHTGTAELDRLHQQIEDAQELEIASRLFPRASA
ncbi:MAG: hypothetical protein JO033_04815 [Acidobacteriaceae bacterium]|nr:hypothetical protein [Acidobacteriaceae bacterium]MBV9179857.1 hypothetical protein [Acidobacteriota bacterium]